MREIKFRGKRLDNGEWAYGSLITCHKYTDIWTPTESGTVDRKEVDPETVGQYTGLKDSNGKEIYEGDVLKITQVRPKYDPHKDLGTCEVKFSSWHGWNVGTRFDRYAFDPSNPIDVIEIVGNIHDNPELQKGGEK